MPKRYPSAVLLAAVLALPAAPSLAAEPWFPFTIPFEMSPDSEIAFTAPPIATDAPRVIVREGHFFHGRGDGDRLRVWGVNFCFAANFPTHENAQKIAARLAAFGVNSVRLHHMDSRTFPGGIWDPADPMTLSAEALDRLDYFVDQLARRGIYTNLNLHVSRTHSRYIEGLPSPGTSYDKIADLFEPQLIAAQKDYARQLLTHVNPYRKVRWAEDPAVAFVEINNENSFFMWGGEQKLRSLPEHYQTILRKKYNAWLAAKYGDQNKLRAAWSKGTQPLGENIIDGGMRMRRGEQDGWVLEQHHGAAGKASPSDAGVRVEIETTSNANWHMQFHRPGLKLAGGTFYTLSFRARSDEPRKIRAGVNQAHEPWRGLGLSREIALSPQWQTFRMGFTASADDDNARITFAIGDQAPAIELADVQLQPGGQTVLADGESLKAATVQLFTESPSTQRELDRMEFLAATEKAYWDDMRRFIRKDLGCGALVTGTIAFGPLGLWTQSDMDFIDTHAYWQHPHFPGRPWDPGNWTVGASAMVEHIQQSPLWDLSAARWGDKPLTCSEYNHSAPNPYQAECVPMISSWAAADDWDGVWLFAYSHSAGQGDSGYYASYFDIQNNPAKWAFMPAGTVMFREAAGWDSPVGQPKVTGEYMGESRPMVAMGTLLPFDWSELAMNKLLRLHQKHDRNLQAAVQDGPVTGLQVDVLAAGGGTLGDDKGPWLWRWIPSAAGKAASYTIQESRARCEVVKTAAASPKADLRKADPDAFYCRMVAALDGKPLTESKRVLVTVLSEARNTGMEYSEDMRTVGRAWGKAPVLVSVPTLDIPLGEIGLPDGDWTCHALKPDGSRGQQVKLDGRTLGVSPEHRTVWYLLTRE